MQRASKIDLHGWGVKFTFEALASEGNSDGNGHLISEEGGGNGLYKQT